MKSDAEIRDDVIDELRWDPQISDADAIGVAVQDGAVTLTGHVPSYAEKLAAARAAERVYGVKAVANDLTVKLAGAPRDDSDIATAIAHVLENNVQIPEGRVHARVQNGWVTLEGEVDYEYQRREVERMVRQVRGVIDVIDTITIKPARSRGRSPEDHRGRLQARGRGGRPPRPGRCHRPHRRALRPRALTQRGQRRPGRSRLRPRSRHRGKPPRHLAIAGVQRPEWQTAPTVPTARG